MNDTTKDCCADPSQKLLSVEQGRQRILDAVPVIADHEQLHLRAALNRVLAEPVVSAIDVPPFANSAMDGYAIRHEDCSTASPCTLNIIGTSFAGTPFTGEVKAGQCIRIMTGAVMPDGADTVLMQETVERDGEKIQFDPAGVKAGQHVRYAGEDTRTGQSVLEPGKVLGPAELGLLASVGVGEIRVWRRLRVAFFSTGDELASIGTPLQAGQIYDSNRYALYGLLSNAGIDFHDLGVIPDQREAVRDAFRQAADMADLVLTSGGVSVGEADFVTETLEELGEINFWRMAMKPGKPLAFGKLDDAVFFGLPGNPVSAMVTFYQFVLPAIRKMGGIQMREPLVFEARCANPLKKAPGRTEFQRGVLQHSMDGSWQVSTTGLQGSHVLRSMSLANCFILLPAESTGASEGENVLVQPFCDLGEQ
ncbi:molybdopterin molybdochelatase [Thiogranum longum]|uniref:Molybdopterin molybdenumtransferase n=1 Tax=Thiogranum longum TaxID=1537524 RepID=A0A4R1HF07_9GAMM|nr:gephyrin-like molybdotransferase Glp [Thiogranum longum]TCK18915.1 molybdopterin molybdochelatase [Thiogranum longum]